MTGSKRQCNLLRGMFLAALTAISGLTSVVHAMALSDTPLFLNGAGLPLNMLVVGRDHKLFTAAYNDASDLDGDGQLDVGYKPLKIDYYGYFDSYKCYTYSSGIFSPAGARKDDKDKNNKKCSNQWSGDFLNYITTSRVDALRKVFYGGYRSTDSATQTVLERAYIPQDAHSWGKEYQSVARDGYDIKDYAPLSAQGAGKYILFANTTLSSTLTTDTIRRNPTGAPLMRVLVGTTHRVWEWVSKEGPVAGDTCANPGDWSSVACDGSRTDYTVRVEVCKSDTLKEPNCQQYGTNWKPTGLFHDYSKKMAFGLLSGSYMHNHEGGVLRKQMGDFSDEVNSDGTFSGKGIIKTMNSWKIQDYTGSGTYNHDYNCTPGWSETQSDGSCRIWGNPIGEMMLETLRYFAGASSATSAYTYGTGSDDEKLGATVESTWKNPYGSTGSGGLAYPACSKPFETVVSDINPSYDSELPGGSWGNVPTFTLPSKISSINVSSLGTTIWNNEFGAGAKNIYIGQVGSTSDGAPTAKSASSFGNIRGLSPEEPTRQGTYYSASVAYFGHINDISAQQNSQLLNTFAVALSSPLPKIEMPVSGKTISLVPFAKVVSGPAGITATWQPTSQIVGFYIDTLANLPGQPQDSSVNGGRPFAKFRINFEDAEQGNDYDMDEIVLYTVKVNSDNTVSVQLKVEYASAGYESHLGYVISGTANGRDGIYLEVTGGGSGNTKYKFDTPSNKWAGGCVSSPSSCNQITGTGSDRVFSPGNTSAATLLQNPLWYAAKYGGFTDSNKNGLPDDGEWNTKNSDTPDNYFLVTNALTLGTQLSSAFNEIIDHTASASSASVNSGAVSTESRVYQATFKSPEWLGHLLSFKVDPNDGSLSSTAEWDAADKLPAAKDRSIFTVNSSRVSIPFDWTNIQTDSTRKAQLDPKDTEAQNVLNYVRGDATGEGSTYRKRLTKLGDIVNSSPMFVGAPAFYYSDKFESAKYSTYRMDQKDRKGMVYFGANDGMLHGIDAKTGIEQFAFIPSPVFGNLSALSKPSYNHKYFVDGPPNMGDVFINKNWQTVLVGGLNKGGQGIYALNITDPANFGTSSVLWEFTDKDDKDLGYTFSQPAIVRLKSGAWAAIFGNGYNNTDADGNVSSSGTAVLYVVNIATGALIAKIDTKAGATANPNGLATPAVVDLDGDSIADYVYAGDLLGNMWKFDIRNSDPSKWSIPYTASSKPAPLYVAKDASGNTQPITSRPEVARGPKGVGMLVLFGTGKYLEDSDKIVDTSSPLKQTFYGILDPNSGSSDAFSGRKELAAQTIDFEQAITIEDDKVNVRVTSDNAIGAKGWYMDLVSPSKGYQGERVVSNPIFRDGRIIFTTLIPKPDPCDYGGDSWIMELNAQNGGRLSVSPFDVNHDGKVDGSDVAEVTKGDGTKASYFASGVQSEVGITPEPGILADQTKPVEYKYSAGSSGEIQTTTESASIGAFGRQSWRSRR